MEFLETPSLHITPEKSEELSAYAVRDGDILVSRAGTVGKMAIVRSQHTRVIIHTNLIRLSLNPGQVLPVFFTALVSFFASRLGRLKRGQEGAYTFMSTTGLSDLIIPLPPMYLQKQFAALVERHERLRRVQREALRQAEHLFQTLLHRAFTVGL
jgi:type I restriction enzyme S subunit